MAVDVNKFDAARLAREAEVAGQAFGFVDIDAHPAQVAAAVNWLFWAVSCGALMGCIAYSFV